MAIAAENTTESDRSRAIATGRRVMAIVARALGLFAAAFFWMLGHLMAQPIYGRFSIGSCVGLALFATVSWGLCLLAWAQIRASRVGHP